jgi:hypothetical protein
MIHNCKDCDYSTSDRGNWYKHLKTNRHITNTTTKTISCRFCGMECDTTKILQKHFLLECTILTMLNESQEKAKMLEEKVKLLTTENKELAEKHNKYVEKQTDDWKELAKTNANIASISTSANTNAIEFLTQNFTKTQPIEKITYEDATKLLTFKLKYNDYDNSDNDSINSDDSDDSNDSNDSDDSDDSDDGNDSSNNDDDINDISVEQMIFHHKNNNLCEYIAEIIVGVYRKPNPNEQTIWNSDESRLVYIIRDVINKENKWIKDQKGEKIKEYVVKPILNVAKEMMTQYCDKHRKIIENHDFRRGISHATIIERMYDASDIVKQINNKKLEKKIIMVMSAPFGINVAKQIASTNVVPSIGPNIKIK